jgi:hypothetical protein
MTTLQIPVFTREALALLFARDSFLAFQKDGFASHYWAPLLAAGCGASRNEVFFLYTDDLIMLDGQWWLGLRRVGERNAPVRRVPLHPWLQDLGFVEFVKEQSRIRPQQRLFAEYKAGRENGGMLFSRAFVHWIKTTVAALPVSQQAFFVEDYHFPSLRALFWQEAERASLSASTLQLLRGGEGNRSQAAAEVATLPIASCFPALPPYCALARGPEQ